MYEVYAERSPAVAKVPILLEELHADYRLLHVDVARGAQFAPAFAKLSPNSKLPLLIDHDPPGGGNAVPVWESSAILLYLAEKAGQYFPRAFLPRSEANIWLFWQAAGLSPMCGQSAHFIQYDLPGSDYAAHRYWKEVNRLFAVLNRRLQGRRFVLGDDYSIVDIACYAWIRMDVFLQQDLPLFPDLQRWAAEIQQRAAVIRAYERIEALPTSTASREERFVAMCGIDASSVQ